MRLRAILFRTFNLARYGSPISFVKERWVLNDAIIKNVGLNSNFDNINNSQLNIIVKIYAKIYISNKTKEYLQLFIVGDRTIKNPAVLRREILKEFGIELKRKTEKGGDDAKQVMLVEEIREIMNIELGREEDGAVDDLMINSEIPFEKCEKFKQLFLKDYVLPERPEKPKVDTE